MGVGVLGLVLGATCPLWPVPAQPVCRIGAQVLERVGSSTPAAPAPAPQLAPVPVFPACPDGAGNFGETVYRGGDIACQCKPGPSWVNVYDGGSCL